MNWYSAHIVMFVEFKSAVQDRFPVWENVVLVHAATDEKAFEKAEGYGRKEEGDDEGAMRWGKRSARWVFAGVRKLTQCPDLGDAACDGEEVTFIEMELPSREAVKKLVAGAPVQALINDRFRTEREEDKRYAGAGPKRGKRRRA